MSNTFEFAERFGFEPPLKFSVSTTKSIYRTGVVNWSGLIQGLNSEAFNLKKDYVIGQVTDINKSNKTLEDYLLFSSKNRLNNVFINNSVDKPYISEGKEYFFKTLISSQSNKTINKKNAAFSYNIALEKDGFQKYRVLFPFNGKSQENSLPDKYAISIEADSYDELEVLLKDLNLEYGQKKKYEIKKTFDSYFKWAVNNKAKLALVYEKAPLFIIASKDVKTLLNDLSSILSGFVNEIGVNEEKVVLKILKALSLIYKEEEKLNHLTNAANKFLSTLMTNKVKDSSKTLFESLYSKMNDRGFGAKNFTELIKSIHKTWLISSWSNLKNYEEKEEDGIQNIGYSSKKILGFYQNGFNFKFLKDEKEGLKIKVTKRENQGGSIKEGTGDIVTKTIGVYHPFQPIRLQEIPKNIEEDDLIISKKIIPAFYLKAFDDKKTWDNFETASWLALDVLSTISGVGNVLKFRHLTKLARLAKAAKGANTALKAVKTANVIARIKLAAGFVEFTSGTVNVMITLSQTDSKFAIALQKYLFYLELITLAGEARVALKGGLKKYAREAIAQSDEAIRKAHPEVFKHLDEVVRTSFIRLKPKIVKGKYCKRSFDLNNCGGKILDLDWANTKITNEGIEVVKKHIGRFEDVEANRKMIKRLEDILSNKIEITDYDKRFYTHEIREFERYKALGYENTLQKNITENDIYNNAHSATLEDYKINELDLNGNRQLYHPDIEEIDFFSNEDRKLLGY